MIFELLLLFQVKHFLADFPLQSPYMLRKFSPNWDFFFPLLAHCAVHAAFTLAIVAFYKPEMALKMAALDLVLHFTMDRLKASPKLLGRFKALTASEYATASEAQKSGNTYFWWSLGLDQAVHHLTHYAIIFMLVNN